ncbi:MAG: CBS domain-containing protein [Candidatus Binatia bacterium]
MTVADVMTRNPVTISVRHSLASALQTIRARRVSVLPVVEGDKLVGLLTARDTCWDLSDLEYREIGAEMDSHPAYVRPDSNLREAAFMAPVSRATRAARRRSRSPRRLADATRSVAREHRSARRGLSAGDHAAHGTAGRRIGSCRDLEPHPRPGRRPSHHHQGVESIAGPAPAYRLRVSTPDPDALVALLEARGHRVVISTTKREGGAARSSGAMRCC